MRRIILTLSIIFIFVVGLSCASAASLTYEKPPNPDVPICVYWDHNLNDIIKELMEGSDIPVDADNSTYIPA